MPFRVPDDYQAIRLTGHYASQDPEESEVRDYVAWLNREVALAQAYLAKTAPPKKSAKETPK